MKSIRTATIFIVSAVTLLIATPVFAQQKNESKFNHKEFFEKVQAQKLEFLLKSLSLEEADAAKFTEQYKAFDEKRGKAMLAHMKAFHKLSRAVKEKKDEAEIVKLTNAYVEAQIKSREFESSILNEFSGTLNTEQLAKLLIGEERFRREQFHKMNIRKGQKSAEKAGQGKKPMFRDRPLPADQQDK